MERILEHNPMFMSEIFIIIEYSTSVVRMWTTWSDAGKILQDSFGLDSERKATCDGYNEYHVVLWTLIV